MATVNPEFDVSVLGVPRIIWEALATGDTITSQLVPGKAGLAGAVQISGTFDSATVKLQYSNDNATFFDMTDILGSAITATSNAIFEFSTAAVYLRPAISGGTNDDVDVVVSLRG